MHSTADIAARQLGHVTRLQVLAAGLSARQISHRLGSGEWLGVQPRVYRIAGVPETWEGRLLAAVLAGPTGTVASHSSAAVLHGLERAAWRDRVEVTVPGPFRPALRDVIVHRTLELPGQDVIVRQGIPSTGGARTVIDLCGPLDWAGRVGLLDDAVGGKVASRPWVCHRASQMAGRPGTRTLVALTRKGAEGEFRSWLERAGAGVFRAGGLPPPEFNVRLRGGGRLLGVVDVLWAFARLVVELDGLRFHSAPAQRRDDAARANRIVLAGYRLLRYTWQDIVNRPDRVVAEIAEALKA